MEPQIRGIIEKQIDLVLTDENLAVIRQMFESIKPYVKSIDDAALGCILGEIQTTMSSIYSFILHRPSTEQERIELVEIYARRIPEIKSRILQTFR